MTGFVLFLPVISKVPKLIVDRKNLHNQKGSGTDSVQLVSPTKQTLDQAKEDLKRNRKEAGLPVYSPTPGNIPSLPKKSKKTGPKKTIKKKKEDEIHLKYKKI